METVLARLSKSELLQLLAGRCRHRHSYLDHPGCWKTERGAKAERIGFLDIESSNLDADFGIILSYCIKQLDGPILSRVIRPSELRSAFHDREVVRSCVRDILKFDRVVTWYGARFDIPFIRARALYHKLDFPQFQQRWHTDLWEVSRRKIKIHSNRLQSTCDFLGVPAKDHPLHGGMWTRALTGDKRSLLYILLHNREDVVSLEKVWKLLQGHYVHRKTSI